MSKKSETVDLVVNSIMEDLEPVVRHHVERVLTVCEAAARATAEQYGATFGRCKGKCVDKENEAPEEPVASPETSEEDSGTSIHIEVSEVDDLEDVIKLLRARFGGTKPKPSAAQKTTVRKKTASK